MGHFKYTHLLATKMQGDHFAFTLVLTLLFIAPQVPLNGIIPGVPSHSSVSMAILGLFIWAIPNRSCLLRPINAGLFPTSLFVFSCYSLLISFVSLSAVSIINALQYFLYAWLSVVLLSVYFRRATCNQEMQTVIHIIAVIAIIYAIAAIISLWTGPIYPFQIGDSGREWGGITLRQGIGFAVNQNAGGGLMVMLSAVVFFLLDCRLIWRMLLSGIMILAILTTISRSAILSLSVSLLAICVPMFLRILLTLRMRISLFWVLLVCLIGVFLLLAGIGFYLYSHPMIWTALKEGFGFGDQSLTSSESERIDIWLQGIHAWLNAPFFNQIFGSGFRNSVLENNGTAWITFHNAYISLLGDFGLIGLTGLLTTLFGCLLISAWLAINDNANGFAGVLAISGFLVHNFSEAFIYSIHYLFMLILTSLFVSLAWQQRCLRKRLMATYRVAGELP